MAKKTRNDYTLLKGEEVKVVWVDPLFCEEITESQIAKEPDIVFTSYSEVIGKAERNLTLACTTANEPRDRTLREVVRIPICLIRKIILLDEGMEVTLL